MSMMRTVNEDVEVHPCAKSGEPVVGNDCASTLQRVVTGHTQMLCQLATSLHNASQPMWQHPNCQQVCPAIVDGGESQHGSPETDDSGVFPIHGLTNGGAFDGRILVKERELL